MKRIFQVAIALVMLFTSYTFLNAWGTWGHQHINRAAVFALPDSMRVFFFNHIDFITEEAGIADIRKYTMNDKAEPDRHYIDLEAYGKSPFDSLPKTWSEAEKKYGDSTLYKNGILPWYSQEMMQKLTDAFKIKRVDEILFLSADLGHYIGDGTMPLHTSLNHDGQLTGQPGVHGFWESQLPELFGDSYNLHVDNARYIPDVASEIWNIIRESHGLADSLLWVEKRLHGSFPQNKIYKTDSSGKVVKTIYGQQIHTFDYAKAYHDSLHGMVEKQMRLAIQEISDLWYTAWVNAGRPDLTALDSPELTDANKKMLKKQYKLWQEGKLWGLKTMQEY
jgi:hypothetical protein